MMCLGRYNFNDGKDRSDIKIYFCTERRIVCKNRIKNDGYY